MCRAQSNHFIRASDYFDDSFTMFEALTCEVFEQRGVIRTPVYEHVRDANLA
jgi:hypothetical protein